jgi:hypothetical protein
MALPTGPEFEVLSDQKWYADLQAYWFAIARAERLKVVPFHIGCEPLKQKIVVPFDHTGYRVRMRPDDFAMIFVRTEEFTAQFTLSAFNRIACPSPDGIRAINYRG